MKQFNKFLLLGALSTLVDLIIYSILIVYNWHYFMAIAAGYLAGFLFNFYVGGKYVFQSGVKVDSFASEFSRVFAINVFALALNVIIVYALFSHFGALNEFYSRAVAVFVVFFWNFFARKIFVYH